MITSNIGCIEFDETDFVSSSSSSRPKEFDQRSKTQYSLLTFRQCIFVPNIQTISYLPSFETDHNLSMQILDSIKDKETQHFELRKTTDFFKYAIFNAFSPSRRET